jgi:hypothetical protein
MNRRLAEIENKPSFVGDIVMENVDLTEATPLVQPIKLLKPKAPYEIRAECDVVYNGGFTCTVRTTVLGVNVAMTVTLDHLSGRVLFICPSGMDPICTLSFRQQPYTKFSVVPAVASRRMRHLPAVSGYIVQALTRIVATDTVLPNGICFHIPLKSTMTTSGRNMDLSTIRKVRSRLQKEEMSRLERLQQEAAAEFADRAAERAAAERTTSHGSVDDFEHLIDTSSSSSAAATPAAASSAASAPSATKSVLSSSASSGVPSAAAAATPLSSSAAAAANKSASAGSAAKTAEAAHREQSGGGWGVGALIGAVGSKVKEARQRQLARAAAELEKEREKRQKLAEDRKERERLREAEAARRKASGIVDSHETASASTGAGASEAHAHGAASVAASAHAIAVSAAAEHSDGGDSHDSHDDEVFDGEKHAELAKEVEAGDLRASKLPAVSETSSAASPPLTLESVDISDPLAEVADAIPSLPPKRPTSKSADKPLVDAETNALLDLAAATAADKPRAPSPAPVAEAAPARPVSPRPAEAVVRPVSPQPAAAVARPVSPQPVAAVARPASPQPTTEAVLSSAPAERVASPKLPSPRPAEPAVVVDGHTAPAAVPVERAASPKPPSPRVSEPSVAAAPADRAPSPAPTPARSVSPKPADAATSLSLHPPRTESPKPELPPKHHEPVPRAASPKPALPAKERKLSSERAAAAEVHAEPTPALHADGSPVRPESPKPSLPPKSAAAVHKIAGQSDAPPTPQRPALPPKGEHAKLHEAHEPAPVLPPKSSDAKRRSLEFAAPPVVASEMKKGGSFESLSAAVPPSDRHEAGGAKSREMPRLQFDVPAAEPAAAAAPAAPAPAVDAHEHVEPLLSPRASDEHNASDNESDWEGLSFEVGSTTADALGSGAEDIDLLAESIFGNTTSPTTARAAKSTALFPGLSGTASIPGNAAPSTSPPRTGMVGKAIGGAARLVKGGKTLVKRTIVDLGDLDDLFGPSHSASGTTRTRANATAAPPVAGATPATPGKSASKPLDDDDDIFGENLVGEVTTNAASVSSSGKQSKLKSLLTRRKPTTADK